MTNIGTKYILGKQFIFDPYGNTLLDQCNEHEQLQLGSNESRILQLLIEQAGQVVSREQLHEFVWREQGFQVDDSSLTQAISTLRKTLHDTIKSPKFIKTVPKRGYLLIATVETSAAVVTPMEISNGEDLTQTDMVLTLPEAEDSHQEVEVELITPANVNHSIPNTHTHPAPLPAWGKVLWVIALLLPILTFNLTSPVSDKFQQVDEFKDIPIQIPDSHAPITKWLPLIKQCTQLYMDFYDKEQKTIAVIATGGEYDQLGLNFIHDENTSFNNKTLQIFINEKVTANICH